MKLYRAGRPSETLRKVIAANVRNPEMFFGDLHAQESALLTGERRVRQLIERFGADNIRQAMDMLIVITERKAKAEVAAMRRGSYTFEDFMDHDGIDLARPVGIRVRLDVRAGPAALRLHRHRSAGQRAAQRAACRRPGRRCSTA